MTKDKRFRKINELLAALAESERALESGTLGLEGLEAACTNARQLFERLVVLRHKAREAALTSTLRSVQDVAPVVVKEQVQEAPKAIRLDTRPPESVPGQTSLIDAIEATSEEVPERPREERASVQGKSPKKAAKEERGGSVADRMASASTADLSKIISLSHKFWFVAELFNGDRITYEKSIEKLNGFPGLKEAQQFVAEEVVAKLKKPADPEALSTFEELVKRRYA